MTREECIDRTDKIIHQMELAIEDLKSFSKGFVDFDDDMEGIGPLVGEWFEAVGMNRMGRRAEILFYRPYSLYTKSIRTEDEWVKPKREIKEVSPDRKYVVRVFRFNIDGLTRQQAEQQIYELMQEYNPEENLPDDILYNYYVDDVWIPITDGQSTVEISYPSGVDSIEDLEKAKEEILKKINK